MINVWRQLCRVVTRTCRTLSRLGDRGEPPIQSLRVLGGGKLTKFLCNRLRGHGDWAERLTGRRLQFGISRRCFELLYRFAQPSLGCTECRAERFSFSHWQ